MRKVSENIEKSYYPFGGVMPGRSYVAENEGVYRFGFNTQERSDEIHQNHYTAKFWEYDSRIGRRWNQDPANFKYPSISSYVTNNDNPLWFSDPFGDEWTSEVGDDGEVNYIPEKGDSYETFKTQYDVTDDEATDIFKNNGLENYLPQTKVVDKTILGFKYSKEEITTYNTFETDGEIIMTSDRLYKLNYDNVSDKAKANHLSTMIEYGYACGYYTMELSDYFTNPKPDTWTGAKGLSFRYNDIRVSSQFLKGKSDVFELPRRRKGDDFYNDQTIIYSSDGKQIGVMLLAKFHQANSSSDYSALTISKPIYFKTKPIITIHD